MFSKPKVFSFFSGSGFLDLGFELSGFDIVYVNEINSAFIQAYRHSRESLKLPLPEYGYHTGEEGDVNKLTEGEQALRLWYLMEDAHKSSDIVGFIGGPPCPDFSVGGKNRGKEGDHGKLSASYIELICQQKPDFFLFENVKGLCKTQKHRIFYEQLKYKLQQSGYLLTERLINAREYGVPQDRDRIILIGFRNSLLKDIGVNLDEVKKTLSKDFFPWKNHISYSKQEIFSCLWPSVDPFIEDSNFPCKG